MDNVAMPQQEFNVLLILVFYVQTVPLGVIPYMFITNRYNILHDFCLKKCRRDYLFDDKIF